MSQQIQDSDIFDIQYTGVWAYFPTLGAQTGTVMVTSTDSAWATAVFTLRRSDSPNGPWFALDPSVTMTPTSGNAISGTIDCSSFAYLGVDTTTGEGASRFVKARFVANGAD